VILAENKTPPPVVRRRPHKLILLALACVTIGVAIAAGVWRHSLPVRGVRIEGTAIVHEADIFHIAAVPMDKPLYEVDLKSIRSRLRQNPYVKDVAVQRDPPDRILIQIEERVPVALVAAGRMYYIDADGMLMSVIRSESAFDLPIITGAAALQPCDAGKRLTHPALVEALHLIQVARQLDDGLYRSISEVHVVADGGITLYTADEGVPVTVGHGNITTKMEKCAAFWSAVVSNRGAQALASVDLRFADQVVARWKSNGEEPGN
jgi:cell division protein FtsQ